jgi:hypothetical protein
MIIICIAKNLNNFYTIVILNWVIIYNFIVLQTFVSDNLLVQRVQKHDSRKLL